MLHLIFVIINAQVLINANSQNTMKNSSILQNFVGIQSPSENGSGVMEPKYFAEEVIVHPNPPGNSVNYL